MYRTEQLQYELLVVVRPSKGFFVDVFICLTPAFSIASQSWKGASLGKDNEVCIGATIDEQATLIFILRWLE